MNESKPRGKGPAAPHGADMVAEVQPPEVLRALGHLTPSAETPSDAPSIPFDVLVAAGRAPSSEHVLKSLGIDDIEGFRADLAAMTEHPEVLQGIVSRYDLKGYCRELAALGEVDPAEMEASQIRIAMHRQGGGNLTDEVLADEVALPYVNLAVQFNVAAALKEARGGLDDVSTPPTVDDQRTLGRTRGVVRGTFRGATAAFGTLATAKGFYASMAALSGMVGVPFWASGANIGAILLSTAVTGGIIYGGQAMSEAGGLGSLARKRPIVAGIWGGAAAISALYATAFVLKSIATVERAGTYAGEVLTEVEKYTNITQKGGSQIADVQRIVKMVAERRIAIVEAEIDPSKRGKGVGNTGTKSGRGPVAQGLEFGLSGKITPLAGGRNGKYIDPVRNVREKYKMADDTPLEDAYMRVLDQAAFTERAFAQKAHGDFIAFLKRLEAKGPASYAQDSIDPRPPDPDPNEINQLRVTLAAALEKMALAYERAAATEGKKFLDNFTSDLVAALGLANPGIEIPQGRVSIDTSGLKNLPGFATGVLPFPAGAEWPAIKKFTDRFNIYWPGEFGAYLTVLLAYLLLVDNSGNFLHAREQRKRREREKRVLDPKLEALHDAESDIADNLVTFINQACVSMLPARYGHTATFVDADYVRFRLRTLHMQQHNEKPEGKIAEFWRLGTGAVGNVSSFFWGAPLEDTAMYNSYADFLAEIKKEIEGRPARFLELIEDLFPGYGTNILQIQDPEDAIYSSLLASKHRAAFLKKRINYFEELVRSRDSEDKVKGTLLGNGRIIPLDGSGTVFLDAKSLKEATVLYALRQQLQKDWLELYTLSAFGKRAHADLRRINVEHQLADTNARLSMGDYAKIGLGPDGQIPEFVFGTKVSGITRDNELLGVDQGMDASAKAFLETLELQTPDFIEFSEMLRRIDTGVLKHIREGIASDPRFAGKIITVGPALRTDSAQMSGFAIVISVTDPRIPAEPSEVAFILNMENTTLEATELYLAKSIDEAADTLSARVQHKSLEAEARNAALALLGQPITSSASMPSVRTASIAESREKFDQWMRLRSQIRALETQRMIIDSTLSVADPFNAELGSKPWIDPDTFKIFDAPLPENLPGTETPERVEELFTLITEIEKEFGRQTAGRNVSFASISTDLLLTAHDNKGNPVQISLIETRRIDDVRRAISNPV